jgi:hypothetical protein
MEPNQKQLLRVAESIRWQLYRLSLPSSEVYLPEEHWSECQTLSRQLHLAATHGWKHCQSILRERLEQRLAGCVERLQQILREFPTRIEQPSPPTLRTIFSDLCALPMEFDGFAVDATNTTISVTTGPVVLEDIDLGPFEIRLSWRRIGERHPYRVIALDANAPCQASDVTHPHVKGEVLCEGEGQQAIRQALSSGRLTDFFQIVTQVLDTYNGESAYRSLTEWQGVACCDCGQLVLEDDRSCCERCDQDLCLDCLQPCSGCDYRFCHSCTDACHFCDSRSCRSCRRFCDCCDRVCCASCLSENNVCGECLEQENSEDTLDQIEETTPKTAETVAPSSGVSSAATESHAATL